MYSLSTSLFILNLVFGILVTVAATRNYLKLYSKEASLDFLLFEVVIDGEIKKNLSENWPLHGRII